jgi:hypothetical protein
LYWQATAPVDAGTEVALWLQGPAGRVDLWRGAPAQGRYPFAGWTPPLFVRDRYALRLPLDTPAGEYTLRLGLLRHDGTPVPVRAGTVSLDLYAMHVRASDRTWAEPAYAHPVGAQLGGVVELVGYDLDRDQVEAGSAIVLTLVWRCTAEMDTAYTVFTHLLDAGGQVRGQQDNPPLGGSYPTTLWVPGEYVVDTYEIAVDAGAPPGGYAVEVGMYDANVQRLPVRDPTGAAGDRVLLGAIEVREPPG